VGTYFTQGSVPVGYLTCPFGLEIAIGIKLFNCISIGIGGGAAPYITGWYWLGFLQYDIYPFMLFTGFLQSGINSSFIPGIGFRIELNKKTIDSNERYIYLQLICCYDITIQKYELNTPYDEVENNQFYRFNFRFSIVIEGRYFN